jgi:hypothetical protein
MLRLATTSRLQYRYIGDLIFVPYTGSRRGLRPTVQEVKREPKIEGCCNQLVITKWESNRIANFSFTFWIMETSFVHTYSTYRYYHTDTDTCVSRLIRSNKLLCYCYSMVTRGRAALAPRHVFGFTTRNLSRENGLAASLGAGPDRLIVDRG